MKIADIPWRLHIVISVIGLLITCTMGYGFYYGNSMVGKYGPLIDAAMEIKLEATTAHLWFEEIISGDRHEDIESVRHHLKQAQWYARAMLKGGQNSEGTFLPLNSPALRSKLESITAQIETFRVVTEELYEAFQLSGEGSSVHQHYDAIFRELIAQADLAETRLQDEVARKFELLKIVQFFLMCTSLLFVVAIVFLIHRFERGRSADLLMIRASNDELQKALQEIKTLQGIIPICSYCKKIRNDEGLWSRLETYIHQHSDAQFSHGVCPDCYALEIEKLPRESVSAPIITDNGGSIDSDTVIWNKLSAVCKNKQR